METRNVVLVHGAFADGSGWAKVILELERQQLDVRAVQLPLTSFSEDVAATRRVLASMDGPTLLVGHSYAGSVITEAGNAPNVAALLYMGAFVPGDGQSVQDLLGEAGGPGGAAFEPMPSDPEFIWLNRAKFHANFCQDVDDETAQVLAATQKPIHARCFSAEKIKSAAWKSKPNFFLIPESDRMILPEAQHRFAERISAQVRSIESSHVPMVSQPEETADFIVASALAPTPA